LVSTGKRDPGVAIVLDRDIVPVEAQKAYADEKRGPFITIYKGMISRDAKS